MNDICSRGNKTAPPVYAEVITLDSSGTHVSTTMETNEASGSCSVDNSEVVDTFGNEKESEVSTPHEDSGKESSGDSGEKEKKEIKCLLCNLTFGAVMSLKRHVAIFHVTEFKCNVCNKYF